MWWSQRTSFLGRNHGVQPFIFTKGKKKRSSFKNLKIHLKMLQFFFIRFEFVKFPRKIFSHLLTSLPEVKMLCHFCCYWLWTFFFFPLEKSPLGMSRNAARERYRVKSLRNAFQNLQKCLPSVPPNTKLSKLDVLILATTYISHLSRILSEDDLAHVS